MTDNNNYSNSSHFGKYIYNPPKTHKKKFFTHKCRMLSLINYLILYKYIFYKNYKKKTAKALKKTHFLPNFFKFFFKNLYIKKYRAILQKSIIHTREILANIFRSRKQVLKQRENNPKKRTQNTHIQQKIQFLFHITPKKGILPHKTPYKIHIPRPKISENPSKNTTKRKQLRPL